MSETIVCSKIKCAICNSEIEYDEGEGNLEDGYTCYDCIKEQEIKLDEMIDNEIEELHIKNFCGVGV